MYHVLIGLGVLVLAFFYHLIPWRAGRVVDKTFPPKYVPHKRAYAQPKKGG